ncbi:uncharacterized protein AB675_5079 [Cyphellophora attinorum]|uniref:Uncharacterized protein n=1 Tax=Cyphellophora attinorum TaxID=1664694 RepID=A0A0N1HSL5_9EURO|nr:uncharacterized protein AB675_5079 [Phialophora attinorum]KPI39216.1 hypothetical protein AB675_5079 [Phialophora attinorum]
MSVELGEAAFLNINVRADSDARTQRRRPLQRRPTPPSETPFASGSAAKSSKGAGGKAFAARRKHDTGLSAEQGQFDRFRTAAFPSKTNGLFRWSFDGNTDVAPNQMEQNHHVTSKYCGDRDGDAEHPELGGPHEKA